MNTTVHDRIYVAPAYTAGRSAEATGSVRRQTILWWLLRLTFGLVPIVAGVFVLARPRLGGCIVMVWLVCVALSLVTRGQFLDVSVHDLVLAIGAYTLASLTPVVEQLRAAASERG